MPSALDVVGHFEERPRDVATRKVTVGKVGEVVAVILDRVNHRTHPLRAVERQSGRNRPSPNRGPAERRQESLLGRRQSRGLGL